MSGLIYVQSNLISTSIFYFQEFNLNIKKMDFNLRYEEERRCEGIWIKMKILHMNIIKLLFCKKKSMLDLESQ